MATRQGSGEFGNSGNWTYSWAGITESDEGNSILVPAHVDELSYQVAGTFGAGTFQLQGSNDNVNFFVLDDWSGTAISATTAKVWRVGNIARYVKPKATAGAAANVTATLHGTPK